MANKIVIQYDKDMNRIKEYSSEKLASIETGISEYRIHKSSKEQILMDGFYFKIEDYAQYNIECVCENCKKTFICTTSRLKKSKHVFCSRECSDKYIREQSKKYPCEICGKMVHRKPYNVKRNRHITCSNECRFKLSSNLSTGRGNSQYGLKGSKNMSWKSDEKISTYGYKLIRKLDHPFRNIDDFVFEHRLVAEKYLLNDTNKITILGKDYLSPNFHVHHMDFDKLNNDVNNLFVLPKGLHMKFHNQFRKICRDENGRIIRTIQEIPKKEERITAFLDFITEVDELRDTKRGDGGFGSTGM